MGGIYIPDREIPKTCFSCPAKEWYDYGNHIPHGYRCPLCKDKLKTISNCEARTSRRADCPLQFVPDHGPLGDLDALRKEVDRICDRYDAGIISELTCLNSLLDALGKALILIPLDHKDT